MQNRLQIHQKVLKRGDFASKTGFAGFAGLCLALFFHTDDPCFLFAFFVVYACGNRPRRFFFLKKICILFFGAFFFPFLASDWGGQDRKITKFLEISKENDRFSVFWKIMFGGDFGSKLFKSHGECIFAFFSVSFYE